MVKNKATTAEPGDGTIAEGGKIPKKSNATTKNSPNGGIKSNTSTSDKPAPATEVASPASRLATLANPYLSDATLTPKVLGQAYATGRQVSPGSTMQDRWMKYLQETHEEKPCQPVLQSNTVGVLSPGLAALLQRHGLEPGSPDRKVLPASRHVNSDGVLKFVKIIVTDTEVHVLFRFVPNNTEKSCYPDYKLYQALLQSKSPQDRPKVDFSWINSLYLSTNYLLWYDNQEPQLAYGKEYTTRLYQMTWPADISDEILLELAKEICSRVNEFVVDPDKEVYGPDAQAVLADDEDASSLYWIPNNANPVWNDVVSNKVALRMLLRHTRRELGKHFFASHANDVARFFRRGTLDLDIATRMGAPLEWMSHDAQQEAMAKL